MNYTAGSENGSRSSGSAPVDVSHYLVTCYEQTVLPIVPFCPAIPPIFGVVERGQHRIPSAERRVYCTPVAPPTGFLIPLNHHDVRS